MGPTFRSCLAALVAGAWFAAPGAARAAENQTERLAYVLQFGGLTLADVLITLDETPDRYHTSVKLRSRGLVDMFKTFSAEMAGEGRLLPVGLQAQPAEFRREWVAGDIGSRLDILYQPSGLAAAQERVYDRLTGEAKSRDELPWNARREKLRPVPESMRSGVLDPMAAFIAARQMIRASTDPTTFSVPVYDGLRRYDVVGRTEAPRDVTINDETRSLIPVKGRVEPVFGFDERLQDRIHEGEGKILFSADGRFLPVQIMVGNSLGVGVMNLVADCKVDPAPCDGFGQDQAQAPGN
jgi:hypothetical protein